MRSHLAQTAMLWLGLFVLAPLSGSMRISAVGPRQQVDAVIASSEFNIDAEGWRVVGDSQSEQPYYRASGGSPGGYIEMSDAELGSAWFWRAPTAFLGDHAAAYRGTLSFVLRHSGARMPNTEPIVVLQGGGYTLTIAPDQGPGTDWTAYALALDESAGWRHRDTGQPATAGELQVVLADLSELLIRGEYLSGDDTGGLDSVVLEGAAAAQRKVYLPLVLR